jgi:hypothetical protein
MCQKIVSKVTDYVMASWGLIPSRGRNFFLHKYICTGSEAHGIRWPTVIPLSQYTFIVWSMHKSSFGFILED